MIEPKVYENVGDMVADAANRCGLKPYKVGVRDKTYYAFASSNQAAIVSVAKHIMPVHCKPVPTEEILGAMTAR